MTAESDTLPVYAGVDLGGTSAKLALAGADGRLVAQDSFSTQADGTPSAVIDELSRKLAHLIERLGRSSPPALAGIGMGVPGLVDTHRGVTKFLPNLPTQWREVPVAAELRTRFGCPVRLLNDARAATLGEWVFGAFRADASASFAFFTLGTGVGGGLVIDGRLRLGPLGAAGELGHQTILPEGPPCGCGNRGCLESLASGPAIAAEGVRLMRMGLAPRLRQLTGGVADAVTAEIMGQAAEEDTAVAQALHRAAVLLGIAAANVVTILHPQAIVLGGGVAGLGQRLTEPVREQIRRRVGMFPTEEIAVRCSELGARAGLLGAIALAQEKIATAAGIQAG